MSTSLISPVRRRLATILAAGALVVALPVAAGAQEQESSADPTDAILCEGLTLLQPTSICGVYDPETETSTNPYTEDGDSPGIFGLGLFGLL